MAQPKKTEYKPRTPAERDKAELERRENAYRLGFVARTHREARDSNPNAEAQIRAGYPEFVEAQRAHAGTCSDLERRRILTGIPAEDAFVAARVRELELERAAWRKGWDTADATAAAEGEERLAEIALVTPRKPAAVPPPKVKDQLALLDLGEVTLEKGKAKKGQQWRTAMEPAA